MVDLGSGLLAVGAGLAVGLAGVGAGLGESQIGAAAVGATA
jgi:V/A-type H+-transporting ATPase subunit K